MEEITQKETYLKLKALELIEEIEKLPTNHENGRKIFFLKNFIFNYYGRSAIDHEATKKPDEVETDFVYKTFPSYLSNL